MKGKQAEENIEYQAGAALVGEGIKFKVPFYFGMKLTLTIKPLKPGTIVKISQQASLMEKVSEDENMVAEFIRAGNNLRYACRIVALACTNTRLKTGLLSRLLAMHLLWKVPDTAELLAYLQLAYRQMGAQHFFFIMALTKGMNFLESRKGSIKEG